MKQKRETKKRKIHPLWLFIVIGIGFFTVVSLLLIHNSFYDVLGTSTTHVASH